MKSYDPKCEDLAAHFLAAQMAKSDPMYQATLKRLAVAIQETVEEFMWLEEDKS